MKISIGLVGAGVVVLRAVLQRGAGFGGRTTFFAVSFGGRSFLGFDAIDDQLHLPRHAREHLVNVDYILAHVLEHGIVRSDQAEVIHVLPVDDLVVVDRPREEPRRLRELEVRNLSGTYCAG